MMAMECDMRPVTSDVASIVKFDIAVEFLSVWVIKFFYSLEPNITFTDRILHECPAENLKSPLLIFFFLYDYFKIHLHFIK